MGLSNVILKLGFRRAFDGTVNGDTENSMCIEFAMYLLSFFFFFFFFFVEFKKMCSSSLGCNAQFYLFNKYEVGLDTYSYY